MASKYEDGLHPVEQGDYFNLPQVYHPEDSAIEVYQPAKGAENAPQAYSDEKATLGAKVTDDHSAPEVVGHPPDYDDHSAATDEKPAGTLAARRLLGMKRKTALMAGIVALIAMIAIAVGVGAGVGVSQHNKSIQAQAAQASSASSTSSSIPVNTATPTLTTTQVPSSTSSYPIQTSGFTGMAQVLCPSINNTDVSVGNSTFQVRCAVHWPNGSPAENNNGTVSEVGASGLAAYTLEECLQLCVDYNKNQTNVDPNQNGSGCLAVTFNANLTSSFSQYSQNCFLKDRPGVYDAAMDTTESAVLISI